MNSRPGRWPLASALRWGHATLFGFRVRGRPFRPTAQWGCSAELCDQV